MIRSYGVRVIFIIDVGVERGLVGFSSVQLIGLCRELCLRSLSSVHLCLERGLVRLGINFCFSRIVSCDCGHQFRVCPHIVVVDVDLTDQVRKKGDGCMAFSTVTAHHDRLGRLDIPVLIGQVIENNLHIALSRGLAIDDAHAILSCIGGHRERLLGSSGDATHVLVLCEIPGIVL